MPWTHPTAAPYIDYVAPNDTNARCHNCGCLVGKHWYAVNSGNATDCYTDNGLLSMLNTKERADAASFLESLKEDQKMIVEFTGFSPEALRTWPEKYLTRGKQYEVIETLERDGEGSGRFGPWTGYGSTYVLVRDSGERHNYPTSFFKIIKQGKVNKVTTINWNKVYKYLEIKSEEFNKLNFVKEEAQELIPDPEKRKRLEILRSSGLAQGSYITKLISSMDGINYDLYLKPTGSAYCKPIKGAAFVVDKNVNGHDYPLKVVTICSGNNALVGSIDVVSRTHSSYNLHNTEVLRPASKKDISCVTEGQLEAAIKAGYLNMTDINKVELKPKKISKAEKPTEEVKAAIAA